MCDIDLHQIEIFLSVAKHQNISRAARELYISQPAISNWISKMETDCGMTLFVRNNRGVSLTPDGEELYARLDVAYQRFRVSVAEICQSVRDPNETLCVGCLHDSKLVDIIDRTIHVFGMAYPEFKVRHEMFNYHELRDKLLCDELDVALTLSYEVESCPEFAFKTLRRFKSNFVVPTAWKQIIDSGAGLGFLREKTLILEAHSAHDKALAICRANGFKPANIKYVNSYILMSTLVSRSVGFTIGGDFSVMDSHYRQTALIPVEQGDDINIVIAYRKDRICPLAQKFLGLCEV